MADLVTMINKPVTIRKAFTALLCLSLISAHGYYMAVGLTEDITEDIWDVLKMSLHCIGIALNVVVIIGLILRKPNNLISCKNQICCFI